MPISTMWLRLLIYLIEFSICEGLMSWSGACYMSAGLVKRGRKPILIGPMLISVTQMLARIIFHEESICKKREKDKRWNWNNQNKFPPGPDYIFMLVSFVTRRSPILTGHSSGLNAITWAEKNCPKKNCPEKIWAKKKKRSEKNLGWEKNRAEKKVGLRKKIGLKKSWAEKKLVWEKIVLRS